MRLTLCGAVTIGAAFVGFVIGWVVGLAASTGPWRSESRRVSWQTSCELCSEGSAP